MGVWYDCQWRWAYFKVIGLCHIKFLKNGVWYGKSYYRQLIGNHTLAFNWCHFWWPWSTFEGHFSLGCHFHAHFSYPWHAFASHGLPVIAELLVLFCSLQIFVNHKCTACTRDLPELGRDVKMCLTSVEWHDEATDDSAEVDVIPWCTARRSWLFDSSTLLWLRSRVTDRTVSNSLERTVWKTIICATWDSIYIYDFGLEE